MDRDALTMTSILGVAGVTHFTRPETFDGIVPPGIGSPRFWTYASGAAELGTAALIAVPRTRALGGMAATALMIAVYPANIYTVKKYWRSPAGRTAAIARLPLQIPLIRMSLRLARGRS